MGGGLSLWGDLHSSYLIDRKEKGPPTVPVNDGPRHNRTRPKTVRSWLRQSNFHSQSPLVDDGPQSCGESHPGFIFSNVQRLWIDCGMRLQWELRNVSRCFAIQKLFTQKRGVN